MSLDTVLSWHVSHVTFLLLQKKVAKMTAFTSKRRNGTWNSIGYPAILVYFSLSLLAPSWSCLCKGVKKKGMEFLNSHTQPFCPVLKSLNAEHFWNPGEKAIVSKRESQYQLAN